MVSSPLQSLAQLDLHVPPPTAILPEDVLTMRLLANLLDVQPTNVTQHPTNAKLLFQAVMMVMHVPLIPSTQLPAAFTLQNALLQMDVPLPLAPTDNALALQRIVMTATLAPSTLAIFALELASTLLSLALAVLETSELATLKLLSVKSENLALTTVTAQLTETQLTLQSVNQILDALMSLTSKF